jgi:hypothetical protein
MARKHNTKHPDRGRSNYPARLSARGLGKTPAMTDVETLRSRHANRIKSTGQPWPASSESEAA